jgi:quercetin dioxygenase-like cupin family protein
LTPWLITRGFLLSVESDKEVTNVATLKTSEIPIKKLAPGFSARLVHSESMTVAYVQIDAGAELSAHSHPHEQIVNLIEGEFILTVDGEPHLMSAGSVFVLQPNKPHSGKAVSACRLIDMFHPVREDLK